MLWLAQYQTLAGLWLIFNSSLLLTLKSNYDKTMSMAVGDDCESKDCMI